MASGREVRPTTPFMGGPGVNYVSRANQSCQEDYQSDESSSDDDDGLLPKHGKRRLYCVGGVVMFVTVAVIGATLLSRDLSARWTAEGVAGVGSGQTAPLSSKTGNLVAKPSREPTSAAVQEKKVVSMLPESGLSKQHRTSLYCFIVMLPSGNERKLVKVQYERGLSIFGCDEHAVFSNETLELSPGRAGGEKSFAFGGDMVVNFNDWTWKIYDVKLALNTGVFIRVWKEVFRLGHWRNHDWIVKLDPDTVFIPSRLRYLMQTRPLLPVVHSTRTAGSCGNCSLQGDRKTCAEHVVYEQSMGLTCGEALHNVARIPPTDCGCDCGADACIKPSSVYLRNCAVNLYTPDDHAPGHAMHGPLEVLSHDAAADLEAGLSKCAERLEDSLSQWGEDWFLEHCLLLLGVNPVDSFSSLKDGDCSTVAWPCNQPHAAFQPFKSMKGYLQCHDNAIQNGSWPPTSPQYAEHKHWSTKLNMWITKNEE